MRCDVMLVCWIGCSWLVEVLEGPVGGGCHKDSVSIVSLAACPGLPLRCGASGTAGHSERIRWETLEESLKIVCVPPDMKGGEPVTGQCHFL